MYASAISLKRRAPKRSARSLWLLSGGGSFEARGPSRDSRAAPPATKRSDPPSKCHLRESRQLTSKGKLTLAAKTVALSRSGLRHKSLAKGFSFSLLKPSCRQRNRWSYQAETSGSLPRAVGTIYHDRQLPRQHLHGNWVKASTVSHRGRKTRGACTVISRTASETPAGLHGLITRMSLIVPCGERLLSKRNQFAIRAGTRRDLQASSELRNWLWQKPHSSLS